MLARLGDRVCAVFRLTAPDPFVLAVLLTIVTLALALALTDFGAGDIASMWAGSNEGAAFGSAGVWALTKFAMQMCLILVTGHVLACSPPVSWLIARLTDVPRSAAQGAALVALVAGVLGTLNWGLGLVGGALIARRVGLALQARSIQAHYPLLCAAGYVGLMVWHGGFSGTAPLSVSTRGGIANLGQSDLITEPIPITQTLLSPMNIVVTGGLLLLAPLVMALLTPKAGSGIEIQEASRFIPREGPSPEEHSDEVDHRGPLPRFLEDTPVINVLLVLLILPWAWGFYFPSEGASGIRSLGLDSVNLTMLMLGLALHPSPRSFLRAVDDGVRGCGGIMIQFPLYAGIMAVMSASGLTAMMAEGIASISNSTTLPLLTFVSAGVVNLFVPSGGGQWAVQGPIAVSAAGEAGVPISKIVMSVAYGDQLTNMLQPFWALPLLAITGVKARDIVGYTTILMVLAIVWIGVWLVVF